MEYERKSTTRRTKQMNFRVTRDDHHFLVSEAKERGVLMITVLEEALALYRARSEGAR